MQQNQAKQSQKLQQNQQFVSINESTSQYNLHEQQQASYPICLNTSKYPQKRNTLLSRLSEVTYQSELKILVDGSKDNCNIKKSKDKLFSTQQSKCIYSNDNFKNQLKFANNRIIQLENSISILQKRNQEIAICLEKQKLKNLHLQQALNIIKKQDKQLDKKINQQLQHINKLKIQLQNNKNINQNTTKNLQQSIIQNKYLKQLILLANNNYENLQKKYQILTQKNKYNEQQNLNRQKQLTTKIYQIKNLLTNFINNSSTNPSSLQNNNCILTQQDQNTLNKKNYNNNNTARYQKKHVEDIFRKMFIKTLKTKK